MKIDQLKKFEGEEAIPNAKSMIESFRSIGYSLPTAIADIIDNSIAAKAKNIWIDFQWAGPETSLVVTDDGKGMSKSQLVDAMRPGSKNPLLARSQEDLGRFGLGLKTASFSQCRNLTVATKSKKTNKVKYRCWNLNYVAEVNKWKVLKYLSDERLIARLNGLESGTSIIWQNLDRVISINDEYPEEAMNQFLEKIEFIKTHLSMVFHQYIENQKLTIWIKERKINPWDPYLKEEKATKVVEKSIINDEIEVVSYVLPLHSKIDRQVFENASGIKGWNSHQGFYIYRNNRLLLAGDWLGMYKQEEHYKLARIFVNIPNTVDVDNAWQLDIKKSVAMPPPEVKVKLKEIADKVRKEAVEVYRQIGVKRQRNNHKNNILVWTDKKSKGRRFYQINRAHPIIKNFLSNHPSSKAKLNRLFRIIEETVPLPLIVSNETENNDFQTTPFEGKASSDMVKMIIELYETHISVGKTRDEAIDEILRTEPFAHYPELIENI
ncbi:ATP-binding protein [Flagellimonas sp. CMM7]|uniref:ATP-binding protein n=1 Tax=Flagellimonas sp. CMM7 TaxID=2654676 RepID=UPI0013D4026F|nr:ATP-binding protein [Flagellimonas sp. CMM7]UII78611.1 ATP-binding protein [Flagellimonas sp. CMM7]